MSSKPHLFAVMAALVFSGCVTLPPLPEEYQHLTLERRNSPLIAVHTIGLASYREGVYAVGYVTKHFGVLDTWSTHLRLTVYDQSGGVLSTKVGYFSPRDIPPGKYGVPVRARYSIRLDPLPPSGARIEVRAERTEGEKLSQAIEAQQPE